VENVGGGDIAANVGSEQNSRATSTALAFTTTQAHLFTTPLTSIARLSRACTSTVSFTTAWFRLGAVVAYRPDNFRVTLMRLSLPTIPQPTTTPLQTTAPLSLTITVPMKRSKTAPGKGFTDRKPRMLRSQSHEPRIRSILSQTHSSRRPQINSAHSRKRARTLQLDTYESRYPSRREHRNDVRPTPRALLGCGR
jgi:hypothetical protein